MALFVYLRRILRKEHHGAAPTDPPDGAPTPQPTNEPSAHLYKYTVRLTVP